MIKTALEMLDVFPKHRAAIVARWKAEGGPALLDFAPYTAHVMAAQAFFGLCFGKGLIAKERPSNKMDMAYLFYLPFCEVFVSGDRLHARTVPLFTHADQRFILTAELKADLAALDVHYSAHGPGGDGGAVRFRPAPPMDCKFLVQELWDRTRPG